MIGEEVVEGKKLQVRFDPIHNFLNKANWI